MSEAATRTRPSSKAAPRTPPLYKVLLLNDDYTPMDFVVEVLMRYFRKSEAEAVRIMLQVHHTGVGVAGVYPFEIAETKVNQVRAAAQREGHPLQCTLEPE
ncbi:MAG: ATP-dependent Clp protease adapter ClpS [Meiothermus sp.]|uniref:ATP-dependent Clp protease adapter ClpS n=1 Tax=Meiothermus sp. TaxID=1955249 RepID=UPI0025EFAE24|nr:ATP-dependent Clp protease adapter ClpS [Meiothermus sp.]MCS7057748.1 ATP-dependent Clp protease adapter ClpS [Meiothermus sp.]MCS7194475.1 ATP-dependent Clp protease adapter ClpS [Meiothermus sp.]MCX7739404.1 ATP-dependent Clp protease adapter ClpS [Meiothermus sp.]MDW8091569.1 ATP-dependent Clp protease adapter ClpS [Meiothermus sp.]MDW8482321.1 ATP-dependent Clp protease adapter ClpS [Meiothermus sp.]